MSTIIITCNGLVSFTHWLAGPGKKYLYVFRSISIWYFLSVLPVFMNFPSLLNKRSTVFFPLLPQRTAGSLVARSVSEGCHFNLLHVGRLLDRIALPRKEVLGQSIQNVGAEDFVLVDLAVVGVCPPHDGDVHVDYLELVGSRDLNIRHT